MAPHHDPPPGVDAGGDGGAFGAAETTAGTDGVPLPVPAGPEPIRTGFLPQELVAGRYRIVRLIGRGGMADVYEAEDLELGERVALKTIRAEFAASVRAVERFKRELQLARRIAHANVCRVHDLGWHRPGAGAGEPVLFLTMEYLAGESLAERLRRGGRMSTDAALPLVRQIATALDAAHAAGVIHRDLKSGNVLLVESADGDGMRAVVTDFGLAGAAPPALGAEAAGTGEIVGTPPYMAPEQIEGGAATAAADQYALGVVIYEMVTGLLPFGRGPIEDTRRRREQPPPSPREHVPDLDPRWEASILRCLEREPRARPGSGRELLRSLQPGGTGRRLARWLPAPLVAAAAAALTIGLLRPAGLSEPVPRSVAVLGFRSLAEGAGAAWLDTALAEMLASELSAAQGLHPVPGERVARMKSDLGLDEAEDLSADALDRVRRYLGPDLVAFGSYLLIGEGAARQMRLEVRVQDAASGTLLAATSESGPEVALFDIVSDAGRSLRDRLGPGSAPQWSPDARSVVPSTIEATRHYAEGLDRLRRFDAPAARDLLVAAVAADPAFPPARVALSRAWSLLGYGAAARAEAEAAFERSASLPRRQRLAIESRFRALSGEWERVAEIQQTLCVLEPENLEHLLDLVAADVRLARIDRARAVVERARREPSLIAADLRLDLAEARLADGEGDWPGLRQVASRLDADARTGGALHLSAEARRLEAKALYLMGHLREATAAARDAARRFAATGDRHGEALALHLIGESHYRYGDRARARELYEEILEVHRQTGDEDGQADALHMLGNILSEEESVASVALYQEAIVLAERTGNRARLSATREALAGTLLDIGDVARARAVMEEAAAFVRALGSETRLRSALTVLSSIDLAEGRLADARRRLLEAAALSQGLQEPRSRIATTTRLAALDLEEGQAERAEATLRALLADAEMTGDELTVQRLRFGLARTLRHQGRAAEALQLLEVAALPLERLSRLSRLKVHIEAARIRAATGSAGAATVEARRLLQVAAEASRAGFLRLALEARLARAEIARAYDAGARADIEAVAREAAQLGLGLIARRAEAASE